MGARVDTKQLLEAVPIEDSFVTGVAVIEDIAGVCVRIIFYTEQTCFEAGGAATQIIKNKIVMPWSAFRKAHHEVRKLMMRREALRLVP